jgi:protein-S-isoprenylcysteine O-methyltransferase Ste14
MAARATRPGTEPSAPGRAGPARTTSLPASCARRLRVKRRRRARMLEARADRRLTPADGAATPPRCPTTPACKAGRSFFRSFVSLPLIPKQSDAAVPKLSDAQHSARRAKEVWRPARAAAVWHVPPTMHTSVPSAPGETAVTTTGAVLVGRVEDVTHTQHLIAVVSTAVCWGAFGLTWVGGALYNASRGPRQSTRAPLGRFAIVVVIAGAIFFAIFRAVPTHTWRSLELQSPWGTGIGLVILLGSTVFTLWARFALGTMWTLDAVVKEGHALRTDGPYGITRHPIYTGILGMLLGSLLLAGVGRSLLLLPVALVLFEVKLHVEEELMLATFPDEYPRYRQRVPQLIPGLRIRRVGADPTQTPGGGRPSG